MQQHSSTLGHELCHSREPSGISLEVDRVNPGDFEAPLMVICGESQADSVDAILKSMSSNRHQRPILEFQHTGPVRRDALHAGRDPLNRPAEPIAA
jgi:hypothetical protein